ncbi:MSHA biogenesis protein MshJ [Photobacterium nomapromontoriensis]|uniref:MSHA biogenesis protein MshJ n=1 Tax=Photobacterium nomapromontoriensis TaxID=2910237 RepID=UPI003D14D62F
MNRWLSLCDKFDMLTRREQWLIAVSGWIALLFVGFLLVIEPQMTRLESAKNQLISVNNSVMTKANQLLVTERKLKTDPDSEIDAKIAQLKQENLVLENQLGDRVASLVAPEQMAVVMEQVLQRSKRLNLKAVESLPPVQLVGTDEHGYYIHPLRLTLRGRYFDVVAYLEQLEQLSVKYYWRSLSYKVDNYPWADIQLEVYTLGESEDFIGG